MFLTAFKIYHGRPTLSTAEIEREIEREIEQ